MSTLRSQSIIVIDEEEVIERNDDKARGLEVLKHGVGHPPYTRSVREPASSLPLYIGSNSDNHYERASISGVQGANPSRPSNRHYLVSLFPNPNWRRSSTTPIITNLSRESARPTASRRTSRSRTCSLELSCVAPFHMSDLASASQKLGSPSQPIEIIERDFDSSVSVQPSNMTNRIGHNKDGQCSAVTGLHGRSVAHLDFERDIVKADKFIDLDNFENLSYLWVGEEDLQILSEDRTIPAYPRSSRIVEQRNLPIVWPLVRLEEWQHGNHCLRASKTVEIDDGEFLRVTHIFQDSRTGQITVRGNRLQRCRSMNGLLERKLNEVCLFQEIDLDDPRPPQEQGNVEIPVHKVKGLRTLRRTNQQFPLCRNFVVTEFHNQAEAATEGGLTMRWRYTCTYASAADRWHNNPKERMLECLREEECSTGCGISDSVRRFEWRGRTALGGAYQPTLEDRKQFPELGSGHGPITIDSDNIGPDLDLVILDSCPTSFHSARTKGPHSELNVIDLSTPCRKRRPGSPNVSPFKDDSRPSLKKVCLENSIQELSKFTFGEQDSNCSNASTKLDIAANSEMVSPPSVAIEIISPPPPSKSPVSTTLPPIIDLSCSELATPGQTGIVRSYSQHTQGRVVRLEGQMLTYGDAFCGAGGATRGAAMAGLRVTWGFDFWDHACSTWRTNFPQATCYELSSEEFVGIAQGSKCSAAMDVKVDILHLSPPCQYFSPAHTVNGIGDEMNIASLFAVGPVIKVAKPRIVTLEQTFGIVATRFRVYFNSLIQMFTALHFSVRWAIVPMAQWGLPQRRFRLIIIAACPGEILPEIPAPTHSEYGVDSLRPFLTVNHVLFKIPPNASDHDPESLTFSPNRCMRPWDGNKILPRAMTTSGGQNYHPSGKRGFTLREYASLQGFPLNHVFKGSYVKKQIGNAVPPCVAKVLFESIKKQLDEADGIVDAHETMVID